MIFTCMCNLRSVYHSFKVCLHYLEMVARAIYSLSQCVSFEELKNGRVVGVEGC